MIGPARSTSPIVVAHRGRSSCCPENTRRAFQEGLACGADAIECDIQLTRDGAIVVCHNPTLDHYGHPEVDIATSSLSQLRDVDLGATSGRRFTGERIVTLEELIAEFATSIPLLVEFKTKHLSERDGLKLVDAFLSRLADHERLSVQALCFNPYVLRRLNETITDMPLVWNTNEPHLIRRQDLADQPWLTGVGCRIGNLNQDAASLIHDAGLQMYCFTCNEESDVLKARDLGASAIISDDPVRTRSILAGTVCT